jgi:hypothetical protein
MQVDVFQDWKRESDIIERQMNDLLRAPPPASIADRQVRQIQFVALIERREAAARAFLQSSQPIADQHPTGPVLVSAPDAG